jgi:hypothetical protein
MHAEGLAAASQRRTTGRFAALQAMHSMGSPALPPQSLLHASTQRPVLLHSNGALGHASQLVTRAPSHENPPASEVGLASVGTAASGGRLASEPLRRSEGEAPASAVAAGGPMGNAASGST